MQDKITEYFYFYQRYWRDEGYDFKDFWIRDEYKKILLEKRDDIELHWFNRWFGVWCEQVDNKEVKEGIKYTATKYFGWPDFDRNLNNFIFSTKNRKDIIEKNYVKGFVFFTSMMMNRIRGIDFENSVIESVPKNKIEMFDELDSKYKIDFIYDKETAVQIKTYSFYQYKADSFLHYAKIYRRFKYYIWYSYNGVFIYNKSRGWLECKEKDIFSKDIGDLYERLYFWN